MVASMVRSSLSREAEPSIFRFTGIQLLRLNVFRARFWPPWTDRIFFKGTPWQSSLSSNICPICSVCTAGWPVTPGLDGLCSRKTQHFSAFLALLFPYSWFVLSGRDLTHANWKGINMNTHNHALLWIYWQISLCLSETLSCGELDQALFTDHQEIPAGGSLGVGCKPGRIRHKLLNSL